MGWSPVKLSEHVAHLGEFSKHGVCLSPVGLITACRAVMYDTLSWTLSSVSRSCCHVLICCSLVALVSAARRFRICCSQASLSWGLCIHLISPLLQPVLSLRLTQELCIHSFFVVWFPSLRLTWQPSIHFRCSLILCSVASLCCSVAWSQRFIRLCCRAVSRFLTVCAACLALSIILLFLKLFARLIQSDKKLFFSSSFEASLPFVYDWLVANDDEPRSLIAMFAQN